MNKTSKIRFLIAAVMAAVGVAFAAPSMAAASGESLSSTFSLKPQKGKFLKNGFKPAEWSVTNTVSTTDPEILPTKRIDLSLPKGRMVFKPNNVPVCRDSDVGPPPTNLSVPVSTVVSRCPDSVLGNGTAKFVLNRNNLSPEAVLDGVIVAFNGGLKGGRPLLKVYAYSYDTSVAIYTEATLERDGSLVFEVPQLTSDSSVSELNLSIPSKNIVLNNWGPGAVTVVLPKGMKPNYVLAKCSTGKFPWSADFTHGTRDTFGTPTSPDTFTSDSGIQPCVGATGVGRVGNIKVRMKNRVLRAGRKAKLGITVRNAGRAPLKKVVVKLRSNNRRVKIRKRIVIRNLKPGGNRSKTKRVRIKARKRAKGQKVKIIARSGSQSGKLKIRVK